MCIRDRNEEAKGSEMLNQIALLEGAYAVSYTHLDVYKRQVFQEELNPTFLFMWKGTRVEDEPNYHCHEHLELCYIQSGTGKHRIGDTIYEVKEGDLLVINEGVYHQSLAGEHKTPVAEFYVGLKMCIRDRVQREINRNMRCIEI